MAEKESQSYQAMLNQVEGIIRNLSGGQMDLDSVVSEVEQGYQLIAKMKERLDQTKIRIESLQKEFDRSTEGES